MNEERKFKQISEKVLELSKSNNDIEGVAKSYKNLGDYYYNIFQNDSAYYYFTKAEKTFQKTKSKVDLTDIKLYKANILLFEKDFTGCETSVIEVLKAALIKKDNRLIYDCYITLGNALDGLNNFEKSLEYYNKAFKITNKLKTDNQYSALKAQNLSFIGNLYKKSGQYSTAISYYNKALKFDDFKKNDKYIYSNLINNLAYSKFKLGDKSAINQLNEAYKIRDSLKNIPGIVSSKINISEYYLFYKDTVKALTYISESIKMAHANKIFEDELKTLELLAKIDPKKTQVYNNRFIKLTDSLQNNERATRNKFARIEFETDEILTQKNIIEIEKNQILQQFLYAVGFIFLLLIFGFIGYYVINQKNKLKILEFNQKELQSSNDLYELMFRQQLLFENGKKIEQKRISQELHDGILGEIFGVRFNLYELKNNQDEITIQNCLLQAKKLQEIELDIRNISNDLQNNLFSNELNFYSILTSLFQDDINPLNLILEINIDQNINWLTINNNVKLNIYRILQEILNNTNKYSQAKNLILNVEQNSSNLLIHISDDGVGFDNNTKNNGIGLKNIKNRVAHLKGFLEIITEINKGTSINIKIPI